MIKLGKSKDGTTVYITEEELLDAAKYPNSYKAKLNNQQWAKLRKILNRL